MCYFCNNPIDTSIKHELHEHHISYEPPIIVFTHGRCHRREHERLKHLKYGNIVKVGLIGGRGKGTSQSLYVTIPIDLEDDIHKGDTVCVERIDKDTIKFWKSKTNKPSRIKIIDLYEKKDISSG